MGKTEIQDDITITLQTQKTVVHETVRINVSIQAQVDPAQSEPEFRREVHSALRGFINGEWKIQNIHRAKGNQFESVGVNATVRVSDSENYQLEGRAQKINRIGFELVNPRAEYELTFDEIQAVNQELRLVLVKKALDECAAYNASHRENGFASQKYRISSSRFDNGNATSASNRSNVTPGVFIAASATASPYGGSISNATIPYQQEDPAASSQDDGATDMGVSTRFTMTGTFVLRSVYRG